MPVTKLEVLRLYKNLIHYSRSLKLTDPVYFKRRVSLEFRNNKALTDSKEITFAYKVASDLRKEKHYFIVQVWSEMLAYSSITRMRSALHNNILIHAAFKHTIDYSKFPKVNEHDLEEKFVRGSGPGGSAVNKNSNCVVVTHTPSGTVVKCHTSRCQDENRTRAREMLLAKLDETLNGENSVAAQKKRIEAEKFKKNESKKRKIAALKSEWKKREGLS